MAEFLAQPSWGLKPKAVSEFCHETLIESEELTRRRLPAMTAIDKARISDWFHTSHENAGEAISRARRWVADSPPRRNAPTISSDAN
jgi:hypothetical protein